MVAVGNDGLWRRFAPAVGLTELLGDGRFTTNPLRVEHRDVLIPLIEEAMSERSTDQWVTTLEAAGVPVGPIQTVDEVAHDPQVLARGMITELRHPTAGALRTIGCPVRLTNTPPAVRTAPPLLGEHTDHVLAELGASAERINALHETGAVE